MAEKNYCVHIYPPMLEYENIKAGSPEEAQQKVLAMEWPDSDEIGRIEVMLQCGNCGTDNDTVNKKCEKCGKKI